MKTTRLLALSVCLWGASALSQSDDKPETEEIPQWLYDEIDENVTVKCSLEYGKATGFIRLFPSEEEYLEAHKEKSVPVGQAIYNVVKNVDDISQRQTIYKLTVKACKEQADSLR